MKLVPRHKFFQSAKIENRQPLVTRTVVRGVADTFIDENKDGEANLKTFYEREGISEHYQEPAITGEIGSRSDSADSAIVLLDPRGNGLSSHTLRVKTGYGPDAHQSALRIKPQKLDQTLRMEENQELAYDPFAHEFLIYK